MKKIVYICIIVLLSSCSHGLNKSILEPLSNNELQYHLQNTPDFEDFYNDYKIEGLRTILLASPIGQAKYGDITYSRLKEYYDFMNSLHDAKYLSKWVIECKKEYDNKKFPNYDKQVDSILYQYKGIPNEDKPYEVSRALLIAIILIIIIIISK